MDLTPPFASRLLESVAHSGIDRGGDELPVVSEVRRLPLFRQTRALPEPSEIEEDCRKLHRSREEWMVRGDGKPLAAEHLARIESAFRTRSSGYRPGHFLSLVRLALDILETERSGLTVLERRTLHMMERRLFEMQRTERPAPPDRVAGWLADFRSGDGWRLRGLADLLRYVDEITGHPLVGHPDQATSDVVQLLLSLHWTLGMLVPGRQGPLAATPLDLCLGARSVLANSRVLHLRLGSLQDLVLSPELPLWPRLGEWMARVDHERDATFQLPPREAAPDFLVEGRKLRALDLVLTVGERLERSVRRLSLDESLVALERTLHRRIHRQEARKRHMAVLLRRVFERALSESLKRSMRLGPRTDVPPPPPTRRIQTVPPALLVDEAAWERLRLSAQDLEESRAWGCSTSAKAAWDRLFPGEEGRPEELADLEELLRWALDCRDELGPALDRWPPEVRASLGSWFLALSVRAGSVEIPKGKSAARRRRERATPLQWFAVARVLVPARLSDASVLRREPFLGTDAVPDQRVQRALETWIHRHPWDRSLCGIWPAELRGSNLSDGIRSGLVAARQEGVPWWEIEVRLGMLARELEYRSWLGARERVALLARTLEPPA